MNRPRQIDVQMDSCLIDMNRLILIDISRIKQIDRQVDRYEQPKKYMNSLSQI